MARTGSSRLVHQLRLDCTCKGNELLRTMMVLKIENTDVILLILIRFMGQCMNLGFFYRVLAIV